MEERIIKFIAALRTAGVRISLAESADAFNAVDHLGIHDRENFRISLCSTLVKDSSHLPIFEELFPLFFDFPQSMPQMDFSDEMSPEETHMMADALHRFKDQLREMLDRLIRGHPLSQEELDRLGELIGLTEVNDMRTRDWMVQRMEKALRFREVQQAVQELMELLAEMGMNQEHIEQLRKMLRSNQQALADQLRNYAGMRIAENMSKTPPGNNLEYLFNRPLQTLSENDLEMLRKEVRRLAAALRTRIALRQKRAKNGKLDAKATIRANIKHGNVPFDLKHKNNTLKPKIVVICDVSTSMRPCSELMLSLLYAIQDQISRTFSFAFIDHLEYISPDFHVKAARDAVNYILQKMPPGHYNTDLGTSLQNFTEYYLYTVDNRSTFIVVGDGRNNYNDPRRDLFFTISRRANRTIWLNPEPPSLWGTGDSDMLNYAGYCDSIFQVGTLAQLTAAVDMLLTS